jgi:cell division protein FtsI/penicillin-binding protein 2
MTSGAGNRGPRAGAHRAPRTSAPARGSGATKARDTDSKTGVFGVGLRSRSTLTRALALVVLGAIVGVGILRGGGSSAEQTVYKFLLDWEQGQYQQAASLTTGQPKEVAADLAAAYHQVDATSLVLTMGHVHQQGSSASAAFKASIDLGSIGLQWVYGGHFTLREVGSAWKVIWSPSVIMPGLRRGQRLGVVISPQARALIYSASGQSLIVNGPAYEIGVTPDALHGTATAVAEQLAAVEPNLPAAQVAGQIEAAQTNKFQELITLTPAEYAKVAAQLHQIPGLQVREYLLPLFDSIAPDVTGAVGTETAAVLHQDGAPYLPKTTVGLSGLEQAFQRQLTGTPTTGVYVQDAHGDPLYFAGALRGGGEALWPGVATKSLDTTIDSGVQLAANAALAQTPDSAAIVAVQASTGKILAVASHQAAGTPALDPLAGEYQPGQAFTIVSSAALLTSGHISADSPEKCYPRSQVNGRWFDNVPAEPVSLARSATVRKDFAAGCSTAFAELSIAIQSADLTSAAAEFGIGTRWQLPLPPGAYYAGAMGQPGSADAVAADAIGQGDVRVSPLSMALAAAAADSGRWHAPSLVTGEADPSTAAKGAMSAQVRFELQGLMRDAVVHGSGSAANVAGNVYGQAGNAVFAKPGYRIAWFIGYQADIAFAVAELVTSPSDSAAPLTGTFLRNIHAGS